MVEAIKTVRSLETSVRLKHPRQNFKSEYWKELHCEDICMLPGKNKESSRAKIKTNELLHRG